MKEIVFVTSNCNCNGVKIFNLMPCPSIGPNYFWTSANFFGLDQNQNSKVIFGPVQNYLDLTKTIWTYRTTRLE